MDPLQMGNSQQQNSQPESTSEASTGSDVYNGYLNGIPEQDRPIVAKYAKDWDGNVTRKIQEIHESYKPYKDLGSIEDIQQALTFFDRFDKMPLEVYKLFRESLVQNEEGLREQYGDEYDTILYGGENGDNVSEEYIYVDEYGNEIDPDDLDDYEEVESFQNEGDVNSVLEQHGVTIQELADWKAQQDQSAAQAQENAELDEYVKKLHTTYLQGYKLDEDDNDFLLIQLAKDKTPEQAAEAWKKKFGGQQSRPVPRVLAGQGGVGNDQVDLAKLRGDDRASMVADLLRARKST